MHRLLRRQLRRHLGEEQSVSPQVRALLEAVNDAYDQADDDRRMLERSLELTSQELMQRNRELRADVEARTRAEQALRQRDARTRAILAALPDMLLVVSPDGAVQEVHVTGPNFLLVEPSEVIGRAIEDVLPPALLAKLTPHVAEAAASGETRRQEFEVVTDGQARRYEARLTVSSTGDVVAVVRDQTERLQMTERLRMADRMASVGTLAAGVAHELNNPLAYVLSNLESLHDDLRGPIALQDDQVELVAEALDGAKRMRAITRDLRTFSQPHAEVVDAVDPREVLDSALKIARNEIRHRARLRREYHEIPLVDAQAGKLGQVFLNLVVNAVQALPVGKASDHEILVRAATDKEGFAVIEICDTGSGVPPEIAERIFEPFVTTKPREVGTGLGLSICHNIITSLHGRISVHPREPRGSIFRLRLPPSQTMAARGEAPEPPRPPARERVRMPTDGAQRVLIIDDDRLVANSLRRLLGRRDVVIAEGGREGIEILRRGASFDLVLCDLMMPELSGMDVYEQVHECCPAIAQRIVFMTGGAFSERLRNFVERVPNQTLEKPFDMKALRRVLVERGSTASA